MPAKTKILTCFGGSFDPKEHDLSYLKSEYFDPEILVNVSHEKIIERLNQIFEKNPDDGVIVSHDKIISSIFTQSELVMVWEELKKETNPTILDCSTCGFGPVKNKEYLLKRSKIGGDVVFVKSTDAYKKYLDENSDEVNTFFNSIIISDWDRRTEFQNNHESENTQSVLTSFAFVALIILIVLIFGHSEITVVLIIFLLAMLFILSLIRIKEINENRLENK